MRKEEKRRPSGFLSSISKEFLSSLCATSLKTGYTIKFHHFYNPLAKNSKSRENLNLKLYPLHDLVTWYRINYAGTQVTKWDFQNKGKSGWTGTSSFVLKVPLCNLRPSIIYSVPCDRIVQRAYCSHLFELGKKKYTHVINPSGPKSISVAVK